MNTPEKLKRMLHEAGFSSIASRVEPFVERPTCEEFISRRKNLGYCRYRWESLGQEGRQALLRKAFRRLEVMSPEDFEEESEVIVTVAERP